MEKTNIPCLKRINSDERQYHLVPLDTSNEVVFGRAVDCTINLPDTLISRRHAMLSKTADGTWTIKDNKSLNGVLVNDERLPTLTEHELKDRDIIQIGIAPEPDKKSQFQWMFFKQLRVKKILKGPKKENGSGSCDIFCSQSSTSSALGESSKKIQTHEKGEHCAGVCSSQNSTNSDRDSGAKRKRRCENKDPGKNAKRFREANVWSPSAEMARRLAEQQELANVRMKEQEEKLAAMQRMLNEKVDAEERMKEQLEQRERDMQGELQKQKQALETQQKQFEEELKQAYEQQIKEKEVSLLSRLSDEKQKLIEEKKRVEETLQKEMTRKLDEKDKDLHNELLREKEKLDKFIEKKELEQKMLESELTKTKSEKKEQEESMLRTKEEMLTNFSDLMETELQCSICNELFVQATSLNCSHSYCALCIEQWMELKKQCPVCRAPITSWLRSLVLDSYIDRMVEHLSSELKERRHALVEERKEELKKKEAAKAAAAAASTSRRGARGARGGRGRGRGGGRRGRGGRGGGLTATPPLPPRQAPSATVHEPTITIGSSDISSDESVDSLRDYIDMADAHSETRSDNRRDRQTGRLPVEPIYSDSDTSSSDSDSDTNSHSDSERRRRDSMRRRHHSDSSGSGSSMESIEGVPGSYYGGYGSCFECGRRGHWAPGCPFN